MATILRYFLSGIVIASFNLALVLFFGSLDWDQKDIITSNLVHLLVTEIALLFAFVVHTNFTWRERSGKWYSKLIKFHAISILGLIIRHLLFLLFVFLGYSFTASSIAGIAIAIIINFAGYDTIAYSMKFQFDNAEHYSEGSDGTIVLDTIEEARLYNEWIVSKIEPFLGTKNLEFGAGSGTISALVSRSHKLDLCELSAKNCDFLKTRFVNTVNISRVYRDIFSIKEKGYDCIYSSNVLEHIENDQEVINHCVELLRPKGYLVSFVPAGMLLYSKMDMLLGHYRRYGFIDRFRIERNLARSNRANLVKFRFFNLPGAIGWFIKMRLMGNVNINSRDVKLVEKLLPLIKVIDRLPLPYGQNILFVIQRM